MSKLTFKQSVIHISNLVEAAAKQHGGYIKATHDHLFYHPQCALCLASTVFKGKLRGCCIAMPTQPLDKSLHVSLTALNKARRSHFLAAPSVI